MRWWSVVIAVVGCNNSSSSLPNHGTPSDGSIASDAADVGDAGIDAVSCAACGPITMTVYGDGGAVAAGQPASGVEVYFLGPNQYEREVTTGADGIATAIAPDGTTIMVVHKQSATTIWLRAYEGLLVGDSIIDGAPPTLPIASTIVSTEYFTHPTYSDATAYYLRASCTTGDQRSTSPSIADAVMCGDYASASAVVYATDSQGHLGYTSLRGIDYRTQQGSGNPIALPAFQPGATMTTSFTNLPTSGNNYLEVISYTRAGIDSNSFFDTDLYGGGAGASQTVSGPFVPFGDETHVVATISRTGYGQSRYTQTIAGVALTVPIDVATMPHPLTGSSYNASTDTIEWTVDTTVGVSATTVNTGIGWTTSAGLSVALAFSAPTGGSTTVAIPPLPTALSQLAYTPSQVSFGDVRLRTYVGKTYHDELVGQTGSAALWEGFVP